MVSVPYVVVLALGRIMVLFAPNSCFSFLVAIKTSPKRWNQAIDSFLCLDQEQR